MIKIEDLKDKFGYAAKEIIPAFQRAGQSDIARQISSCGDFVRVADCLACGTRHFAGANRCRSRYCPTCAKLRSMLWLAKLLPIFNEWLDRGKYIFKMNFTIKDTSDLKDGLNLMTGGWRYMTNGSHRIRKDWKARFAGGVRSLEVKTGAGSGIWHPHFHCLVLKDRYSKDYGAVRKAWEHSLEVASGKKGKLGSVWLKGFDKSDKDSEELVQAIIEVFKYITDMKYKTSTDGQINELVAQLHRKRAIQTWGNLYKMDELIEDEFNKKDYDEIKQYVCSICGFDEFTFQNIIRAQFMADDTLKDLKRLD